LPAFAFAQSRLGSAATRAILAIDIAPAVGVDRQPLTGGDANPQLAGARFAIPTEACVCIGTETVEIAAMPARGAAGAIMGMTATIPTVTVGMQKDCNSKYQGKLLGLNVGSALDGLHYLSGGTVCFARALNDTPKVAATLLIGGAISPTFAIVGATAAMAAGGVLNSRKIADTMSLKVTEMSPGQGLSANLVTGFLVLFASKFGLPVSTTHVSCGTLFGIGTVTRKAKWKMIASILLAWVTTLPIAAALSACAFLALRAAL
ncbi:MAG: inorganic phosphate transporter, partial [Bdellovibrionia bacterium]